MKIQICGRVEEMFMRLEYFYTTLCIITVLAYDEIYVNAESSSEMIEKGRSQYQLLQERGRMPNYGTCWKSAVEHLDEGCRNLSEETQSDIALQLTNCFLIMGGHESYTCGDNKKPNLRAICINSMSDRAFHVYTEFFTQTQNMCWFLRGQIWHETISESTFKVGKQLEVSVLAQEELVRAQRESLMMQEKIMQHGRLLEEVLGDLYVSTKAHEEVLGLMYRSMSNFQSWIIGEVSWLNSLIFFSVATFFVLVFTASRRTITARFALLNATLLNFLFERYITYLMLKEDSLLNAALLYADINFFVWLSRYFYIIFAFVILVWYGVTFKDLAVENQTVLKRIEKQNFQILELLQSIKFNMNFGIASSKLDVINESPKVIPNGCANAEPVENQNGQDCGRSSRGSSIAENIHSRPTYQSRYALTEIPNGKYNLKRECKGRVVSKK